MKRTLGKLLFPGLPRLVQIKRVDMLLLVAFATLVGTSLVVAIMLTRNAQIGK